MRLRGGGGGFGLGRWGIGRGGVAGDEGEKNEQRGEVLLLHGGRISGSLKGCAERY